MIIYATTYSIDANPVNQAATMIQNQEFNFLHGCPSTWRIPYTQRVPIKIWSRSGKIRANGKRLPVAKKEYPVDYIGFGYYMSTAINETDPQAATSEGNLLGGVKSVS